MHNLINNVSAMTYTSTQLLTVDQFIAQYGDDSRYELADGELIDRSPSLVNPTNQPLPFANWMGRSIVSSNIASATRSRQTYYPICNFG